MSIDEDFAPALANERGGRVPLTVGVSSSVWMGGMVGGVAHAGWE